MMILLNFPDVNYIQGHSIMSCFHDKKNAEFYATHRPSYPDELFNYLAKLAPDSELVLDCGTGNGQAALQLARHFKKVIAIDNSAEQIKKAPKAKNVEYQVANAETIGLPEKSISMIIVAQALHWFDLDAFYASVKVLLKPNGVLACWCYCETAIGEEVDLIVKKIFGLISDGIVPIQIRYVHEKYKTISFPFHKIQLPNFEMTQNWSYKDFICYVKTWPGIWNYEKNNDLQALTNLFLQIRKAWGTKQRIVRWPIYLLVGAC